jgi:hypothetical protein
MIYIEGLIDADALTQEESTRKLWSQYFVSAMQGKRMSPLFKGSCVAML